MYCSVRGRPHYYSTKKEEYASIRFSLDADLSSLFTWNTKQVFVYVTASWPSNASSPASVANTAVIWDTIITSPSADHLANLGKVAKRNLLRSGEGKSIDKSRGVLRLKNQKPKYQITAPEGKVAGTDGLTLRLEYNVQPWVGALAWNLPGDWGRWRALKGGVSKVFALPMVKEKRKEGEGR